MTMVPLNIADCQSNAPKCEATISASCSCGIAFFSSAGKGKYCKGLGGGKEIRCGLWSNGEPKGEGCLFLCANNCGRQRDHTGNELGTRWHVSASVITQRERGVGWLCH